MPTALLVLLLVALGCGAPSPAPRARPAKRTLTRLPAAFRHGLLVMDDRGERWAYTVQHPGDTVVRARDVPPSRHWLATMPAFAPGGRRLAVWARDPGPHEAQMDLVIDGTTVETPFARPMPLAWSPDGARWATSGPMGRIPTLSDAIEPVVVLVDGVERARHHDATVPAFSPDGDHAAWLAEDDAGRVTLVVDGVERRAYAAPERPTAPPLRRATMVAEMPSQYVARWLVDGRLLVVVRDREGWTVERDDATLAAYPNNAAAEPEADAPPTRPFGTDAAIAPATLVVAGAAPVAAWFERTPGADGRWRVVRDGAPVDGVVCEAWWATPPSLSRDGRHVAYTCPTHDGGTDDAPRAWVVVDGRRFGPYGNVLGPWIADDGAHAAWAVADGASGPVWRYVVDGRVLGRRFEEAWRPAIDATGRHVWWRGRRNGVVWIGVDERPLARADEVPYGPALADDGVVWVIRRRRVVSRVVLPVP